MRFSRAAFRLRNWRSPESAAAEVPRVRARERRARQGGEALRARAAAARALPRRWARRFYREDRKLAVQRARLGLPRSRWSARGAFYVCYALMAVAAAAGQLTLGNMTLYIVAFRQGQQAFQAILTAIGGMYEDNLYMSNLFEYLAIPTGRPAPPPELRRAALGPERRACGFEDVGFRYPGPRRWALRHVSLFIPRGQSLALVGQNGAGKTTLIKLLTRLYEPTEGRILLDGRDLRDWDADDAAPRASASSSRTSTSTSSRCARTSASGSVEHLEDEARHRARGRARRRRRGRRGACRRGSRRSSAGGSRTASSSPAGSGRRSRWPARSCARRRTSWCSTSRPRRSTPRPSTPIFERFRAAGARAHDASSSRTASRRCAWPTGSW